MATAFDIYAAKGNEILNKLADTLGVPGEKAFRVLRSVLHALRNHLNIDESLQLLAQLPMALKAVYVDQWQPDGKVPRIRHLKNFLDEVRKYDHELAGMDFGNDRSARTIVAKVFKVMSSYVSEGEMHDLIAVLPSELREFISNSIYEDQNQPG